MRATANGPVHTKIMGVVSRWSAKQTGGRSMLTREDCRAKGGGIMPRTRGKGKAVPLQMQTQSAMTTTVSGMRLLTDQRTMT